jgi:hypothetical protein
MTSTEALPATVLKRKAVVYIRQAEIERDRRALDPALRGRRQRRRQRGDGDRLGCRRGRAQVQ